ncbi:MULTISPECIES: DUF2157 domain-containing protein [unclassified Mucilaginibacter]|uniref:DUF2157 domain-containing protein n=1 Tax=unclassified Mucilaginibacter TaxID=2617802 RepID=UPI002AC8F65C|nr:MULTISPECIES: DUF2157 domain-containing protein [unclassified Mucilaginibacter]MEB0260565.1 DUF2157 domain-containing protein [Mucilaginibacter sp. 10I4]MEB0278079.1 DUF2157 domain-containing protein [Mucilaginibacter sp. 10B2]MEB0302942.1 DUF2157 domain-containing protein [Mucilaginibacter sp. 5C4]WPX22990.1 DUF2157 domain-containing protein [Mucilaginibacter sp. 5C4]
MENNIYNKLHADGYISDESFEKIKQKYATQLFSVHWELKILLYLGVMLLSGGLGTLVYKNIDTIGHQVILAFIALICIGCFTYCCKNKLPFSPAKVKAPNTGFDYILLLGSISMVTFLGYLQFKYNVFGTNYGMATFIPTVALFFVAYYFDHLGILSMSIASLALWMGVSVTPKTLLAYGTFNNKDIIFTYVLFGIILLAAAYLTGRLNIKRHFKFSYHHYGVHVTFIALLAGFFEYYDSGFSFLWLMVVFALAIYVYLGSFKEHSFYFALLSILYGYFATCCLLVKLIATSRASEGTFELLLLLFILSAVGLIYLIIHVNHKIKADDHL